MVQTGPDRPRLARTDPDRFRPARTGPDWPRPAQTGSDWSRPVQTGPGAEVVHRAVFYRPHRHQHGTAEGSIYEAPEAGHEPDCGASGGGTLGGTCCRLGLTRKLKVSPRPPSPPEESKVSPEEKRRLDSTHQNRMYIKVAKRAHMGEHGGCDSQEVLDFSI